MLVFNAHGKTAFKWRRTRGCRLFFEKLLGNYHPSNSLKKLFKNDFWRNRKYKITLRMVSKYTFLSSLEGIHLSNKTTEFYRQVVSKWNAIPFLLHSNLSNVTGFLAFFALIWVFSNFKNCTLELNFYLINAFLAPKM